MVAVQELFDRDREGVIVVAGNHMARSGDIDVFCSGYCFEETGDGFWRDQIGLTTTNEHDWRRYSASPFEHESPGALHVFGHGDFVVIAEAGLRGDVGGIPAPHPPPVFALAKDL